MGCSQDEDGDDYFLGDSLENSVWVGETETADDWATFTFKDAGVVVVAFAIDNGNNGADTDQRTSAYTYDASTRIGAVIVTSSGTGAGASPGAFALSGDTRTLVFPNYKNSGYARVFQRVRPYAGNTFALAALPSDLLNTVWAGSNPMQTNGWITLVFRGTATGVVAAFTHDNTSRVRSYTYSDRAGNIGSGMNAFTIINSDKTLRLANMFSHGSPVDLTRLR
jgi:hypothetical protein